MGWAIACAIFAVLAGLFARSAAAEPGLPADLNLNGRWDTGLDRHYADTARVPGLAGDPTKITPGMLWYRRSVALPAGDWSEATLTLKGARFAPTVYVNGTKVATAEGGMAPVSFRLPPDSVRPGRTIDLEIALQSLRDLNPADASSVPAADRWRSDVSSELWDDVVLHFSGGATIDRVTPWTEFAHDRVAVHWHLNATPPAGTTIEAAIVDRDGAIIARSAVDPVGGSAVARTATTAATGSAGVTEIALRHACRPWSPDTPTVYRLQVVARSGEAVLDRTEIPWGFREFRTEDRGFRLNGEPIRLRAVSVVWHRWLRDPQARELAWDTRWFETNITQRLKRLGGNTLRFHLGLPPEALLDLCDRNGLMVQLEWPFFHGIKASPASMQTQWRAWLDVAMRHPSVAIVHAWNETEGDELKAAWSAMNAILPEYPPLVVAHRDVTHIHKYWWSLFENLGLYYDSAEQFDRPIMVDEFGGNYLDYRGEPGAYPTVRESFLRFLGREQTPESRLNFQAESNARVAEYWRRLGAAGLAPFCALSSPDDGNTWFVGELKDGQPKPVWAALSAAFAPRSVSLDVWDRNYSPGQRVMLPLQFFNDTDTPADLAAEVRVVSPGEKPEVLATASVDVAVPAHGTVRRSVELELPHNVGSWRLEAQLTNPVAGTTTPVISNWDVRTVAPNASAVVRRLKLAIAPEETELRAFAAANGVTVVQPGDPAASVIVGSTATWNQLMASADLRARFAAAVRRGTSMVLLDVGPRDLGQGYKPLATDSLDGAPRVTNPRVVVHDLFSGIRVRFTETAEPESHLHAGEANADLWAGLPRDAAWLWNGLRAGLVVPATDMEVSGLQADAFAVLWRSRGADEPTLRGTSPYYALELAGFYAFTPRQDDKATADALRARVKFLAEDAPALQDRINPNAPIAVIDLRAGFQASASGEARALVALASAGKNLGRSPVIELSFGPGGGKVILSQALTAGRLQRGHAEPGFYGIRYDPAAEQFVLNAIARAAEPAR